MANQRGIAFMLLIFVFISLLFGCVWLGLAPELNAHSTSASTSRNITFSDSSVQIFSKTAVTSDSSLAAALVKPSCSWKFVRYVPSEYEQDWVANVTSYQHDVCDKSNSQRAYAEEWVATVKQNIDQRIDAPPTSVFSYFVFQNNCTNVEHVNYIEPLAGLTRHPYMCLHGADYLVDKSYMFVPWNWAGIPTPMPKNVHASPKAYYFDLGASYWDEGAGGASQSWFIDVYERRGIYFHGIFCWEASSLSTGDVWRKIPARLKPIYHWYNVPANPEPGHGDNGLEHLRVVAHPDDFVVLKIDIDNTIVEEAFMRQLLDSPELLGLIDEFYFEHHVNVGPMLPYWGTQNAPQKLEDSYRMFVKLRQNGVAAHSWV